MIYLYDDYFEKYILVFSYLLGRSHYEKYSFPFIEKSISSSKVVSELERSNITTIAFSSEERIYADIFPDFLSNTYQPSLYDEYGWLGYLYTHLFFDLQITFEALFYLLPIENALKMYPLYHEMDYIRSLEYVKSLLKYTMLDIILSKKGISSQNLANLTNIPLSTIQALRYKKRDIAKVEVYTLLKIANCLDVKIETLLPKLKLDIAI